jgi:F0F1-type ATP synthase assembly protein I
MMLVMFGARRFVDEEAPLAHLPPWTSIMLLVAGIGLIVLSVLNMLLVRAELAKRQANAKA